MNPIPIWLMLHRPGRVVRYRAHHPLHPASDEAPEFWLDADIAQPLLDDRIAQPGCCYLPAIVLPVNRKSQLTVVLTIKYEVSQSTLRYGLYTLSIHTCIRRVYVKYTLSIHSRCKHRNLLVHIVFGQSVSAFHLLAPKASLGSTGVYCAKQGVSRTVVRSTPQSYATKSVVSVHHLPGYCGVAFTAWPVEHR